jgi:hypothetical protein
MARRVGVAALLAAMVVLAGHAAADTAAAAVPPELVAQNAEPPPAEGEDSAQPDPNQPAGEAIAPDDMSLGEIPLIETMELTPDIARRAIDAYVLVKEKYKDAELELYENLQDFVDQTAQGKAFEADIKAAGFANVTEWNVAITTVGFAYTGIIDDQSADIQVQIEEIQNDKELAQDMKDRMIASLKAMIPSENNRKVIQELIDDPVYTEKVKLLETEAE